MIRKYIHINSKDNVVVMLEKSQKGDAFDFDGREIVLQNDVDFAHKVAIEELKTGNIIYKYGEEIGSAVAGIAVGEWVHDHNIAFEYGR